MKAKELRELSTAQLEEKLGELNNELFNNRFSARVGSLDNPVVIRQARRDIARIKTLITEKETQE